MIRLEKTEDKDLKTVIIFIIALREDIRLVRAYVLNHLLHFMYQFKCLSDIFLLSSQPLTI